MDLIETMLLGFYQGSHEWPLVDQVQAHRGDFFNIAVHRTISSSRSIAELDAVRLRYLTYQ